MRSALHVLCTVFVLASISACKDPVPDACKVVAVEPRVFARLWRTQCYGSCPVYEVTVYEDGRVDYLGIEFVKSIGHAWGQLDAPTMDALRRAFRNAEFFSIGDFARQRTDRTDSSSVGLYHAAAGRACTVVHYGGTEKTPPPRLEALEETFDRLVGIEQWIGTEQERRALAHERP